MRWWTPKEFIEHLDHHRIERDELPTKLTAAPLPEDVKGIRKGHSVEIREVEDSEGDAVTLDFINSTGAVDRDKDTLAVDGWELDNYKTNPVFLFAHDYSLPPIGRALNINAGGEPPALRSRVEFTPKDLNPFGDMIGRMFQKGFMNATSVGFLPKEWQFSQERGDWAIDYTRHELLENSGVPVPSNPEALIQARSAGIDVAPMVDWAEKILALEGQSLPTTKIAEAIWSKLFNKLTLDLGAHTTEDKELDMLGLTEKATATLKALIDEKGVNVVSKALEENASALIPDPPPADDGGFSVEDADGKELSKSEVVDVIAATVKESVATVRTEILGTVD